MYRPFTKKYVYYNPEIIEYPRNFDEILKDKNIFISVTGAGTTRGFSALINKYLPNYHLSVDEFFLSKTTLVKSTNRLQIEKMIDQLSQKELALMEVIAKGILKVENDDKY